MTATRFSISGLIAGIAMVFLFYVGFIVSDLIKAGRDNVALGPLVFVDILLRPFFWLLSFAGSPAI